MYCCNCFLIIDWWWYTSHYVRHGYIKRKTKRVEYIDRPLIVLLYGDKLEDVGT